MLAHLELIDVVRTPAPMPPRLTQLSNVLTTLVLINNSLTSMPDVAQFDKLSVFDASYNAIRVRFLFVFVTMMLFVTSYFCCCVMLGCVS
jgi:hypothetical protein